MVTPNQTLLFWRCWALYYTIFHKSSALKNSATSSGQIRNHGYFSWKIAVNVVYVIFTFCKSVPRPGLDRLVGQVLARMPCVWHPWSRGTLCVHKDQMKCCRINSAKNCPLSWNLKGQINWNWYAVVLLWLNLAPTLTRTPQQLGARLETSAPANICLVSSNVKSLEHS